MANAVAGEKGDGHAGPVGQDEGSGRRTKGSVGLDGGGVHVAGGEEGIAQTRAADDANAGGGCGNHGGMLCGKWADANGEDGD